MDAVGDKLSNVAPHAVPRKTLMSLAGIGTIATLLKDAPDTVIWAVTILCLAGIIGQCIIDIQERRGDSKPKE